MKLPNICTLGHLTQSKGNSGLPWCLSSKESAFQSRSQRFKPWVRKIPWEKEMETHSSILAWEIAWTEELAGYRPQGWKESNTI